MDTNTMMTIMVGAAGVLGGWVGGRKNSSLASDTIMLLNTRMDVLQGEAAKIPELLERIVVLEELVTQRARVEVVIGILERVEEKIDALA